MILFGSLLQKSPLIPDPEIHYSRDVAHTMSVALVCQYFGARMRSPFIKFLNHTCAYIVFLALVFMATTRGGSGNPWLDMACVGVSGALPDSAVFIMILIWVLGG